jgi:hypothetical protein
MIPPDLVDVQHAEVYFRKALKTGLSIPELASYHVHVGE